MPVLLVCLTLASGLWVPRDAHPGAAAPGQRYPVCLDLRRSTVGFAYPVGTGGGSRAGSSIFTGRSRPMVLSPICETIRPAVGNLPSEQAPGSRRSAPSGTLEPAHAAALLPDLADTVMLYKRIRGGQVPPGV